MRTAVLEDFDNSPTPEQQAKGEFERIEVEVALGKGRAWRNVTGTPLDRYMNRRQLARDEEKAKVLFAAGERYYSLVRLAGFEPLPQQAGIMRVDNGQGSPERAHAAKEAVVRADEAMGPTQAACVRRVVVEGWSAEAWAKNAGKHPCGGMDWLRDGLELLAKHWGML